MSFPAPSPGLVIRYSFLWSHEKDAGAEDGSKDRPCAIVVAAPRRENGDIVVIVAPITNAPPDDPSASLEIPSAVCRSLGLDGGRHWLRLDELNRFAWPGYDLRTIPGKAGAYAYGMLPEPLFEHLRAEILKRQRVEAPEFKAGTDEISQTPGRFQRRISHHTPESHARARRALRQRGDGGGAARGR